MVSERRHYKDLDQALTEFITQGLISAWDESGLEFTHQDVKDALERVSKNYDVDKEINWAYDIMK